MKISPLAGKLPEENSLVNIPKLVAYYFSEIPNANVPEQRVSFGTSGHRGSSFKKSFNESHILAITQAICDYRLQKNISGPLFLGMDTHALSVPALESALEVLAANGVDVMLSTDDEFTPTPAISHAILTYNNGRKEKLADGIVITPSHNPPAEGGFKYNPPNGGPADIETTSWIQLKANDYLLSGLSAVKRMPYEKALAATTTHRHDYVSAYVKDLKNVINMEAISKSGIKLGIDPLGGAGVHYWKRIAEYYKLNLTVVNEVIDPTFRFVSLDWDGQIRMDPSSPYSMHGLIALKDRFDVAFSCDTDHDRHGIVTKSKGLMPSNHFLSASIHYLLENRPRWKKIIGIGKTVVSSRMIDLITAKFGRDLFEVPAGFKWFVEGLLHGKLGFVGEESAGASFLRLDGSVWTTDKDGIIMALLAAEITAQLGRDPGTFYSELTKEFGNPIFDRVDAFATDRQKNILKNLSPKQIKSSELAGEKIQSIITKAPGNRESIGGIKVDAKSGWFAARPSGTESIYKIYAESFLGQEHLERILSEAQAIVDDALINENDR